MNPSIPATNLWRPVQPRWSPYLGQTPAASVAPPLPPAPVPDRTYLDDVGDRSIGFGVSAVIGVGISLVLRSLFPSLRWTREEGVAKLIVGGTAGVVATFIPTVKAMSSSRRSINDIMVFVGGYMTGSGLVDQVLPRKTAQVARA